MPKISSKIVATQFQQLERDIAKKPNNGVTTSDPVGPKITTSNFQANVRAYIIEDILANSADTDKLIERLNFWRSVEQHLDRSPKLVKIIGQECKNIYEGFIDKAEQQEAIKLKAAFETKAPKTPTVIEIELNFTIKAIETYDIDSAFINICKHINIYKRKQELKQVRTQKLDKILEHLGSYLVCRESQRDSENLITFILSIDSKEEVDYIIRNLIIIAKGDMTSKDFSHSAGVFMQMLSSILINQGSLRADPVYTELSTYLALRLNTLAINHAQKTAPAPGDLNDGLQGLALLHKYAKAKNISLITFDSISRVLKNPSLIKFLSKHDDENVAKQAIQFFSGKPDATDAPAIQSVRHNTRASSAATSAAQPVEDNAAQAKRKELITKTAEIIKQKLKGNNAGNVDIDTELKSFWNESLKGTSAVKFIKFVQEHIQSDDKAKENLAELFKELCKNNNDLPIAYVINVFLNSKHLQDDGFLAGKLIVEMINYATKIGEFGLVEKLLDTQGVDQRLVETSKSIEDINSALANANLASVKTIGDQLIQWHVQILSGFTPLYTVNAHHYNNTRKNSPIAQIVELVSRLRNTVWESIIFAPTSRIRDLRLVQTALLARYLFKQGNYELAKNILGWFHSPTFTKLLSLNSAVREQCTSILAPIEEKLGGQDKNNKKYRAEAEVENRDTQLIPLIGILMQDMGFANDLNSGSPIGKFKDILSGFVRKQWNFYIAHTPIFVDTTSPIPDLLVHPIVPEDEDGNPIDDAEADQVAPEDKAFVLHHLKYTQKLAEGTVPKPQGLDGWIDRMKEIPGELSPAWTYHGHQKNLKVGDFPGEFGGANVHSSLQYYHENGLLFEYSNAIAQQQGLQSAVSDALTPNLAIMVPKVIAQIDEIPAPLQSSKERSKEIEPFLKRYESQLIGNQLARLRSLSQDENNAKKCEAIVKDLRENAAEYIAELSAATPTDAENRLIGDFYKYFLAEIKANALPEDYNIETLKNKLPERVHNWLNQLFTNFGIQKNLPLLRSLTLYLVRHQGDFTANLERFFASGNPAPMKAVPGMSQLEIQIIMTLLATDSDAFSYVASLVDPDTRAALQEAIAKYEIYIYIEDKPYGAISYELTPIAANSDCMINAFAEKLPPGTFGIDHTKAGSSENYYRQAATAFLRGELESDNTIIEKIFVSVKVFLVEMQNKDPRGIPDKIIDVCKDLLRIAKYENGNLISFLEGLESDLEKADLKKAIVIHYLEAMFEDGTLENGKYTANGRPTLEFDSQQIRLLATLAKVPLIFVTDSAAGNLRIMDEQTYFPEDYTAEASTKPIVLYYHNKAGHGQPDHVDRLDGVEFEDGKLHQIIDGVRAKQRQAIELNEFLEAVQGTPDTESGPANTQAVFISASASAFLSPSVPENRNRGCLADFVHPTLGGPGALSIAINNNEAQFSPAQLEFAKVNCDQLPTQDDVLPIDISELGLTYNNGTDVPKALPDHLMAQFIDKALAMQDAYRDLHITKSFAEAVNGGELTVQKDEAVAMLTAAYAHEGRQVVPLDDTQNAQLQQYIDALDKSTTPVSRPKVVFLSPPSVAQALFYNLDKEFHRVPAVRAMLMGSLSMDTRGLSPKEIVTSQLEFISNSRGATLEDSFRGLLMLRSIAKVAKNYLTDAETLAGKERLNYILQDQFHAVDIITFLSLGGTQLNTDFLENGILKPEFSKILNESAPSLASLEVPLSSAFSAAGFGPQTLRATAGTSQPAAASVRRVVSHAATALSASTPTAASTSTTSPAPSEAQQVNAKQSIPAFSSTRPAPSLANVGPSASLADLLASLDDVIPESGAADTQPSPTIPTITVDDQARAQQLNDLRARYKVQSDRTDSNAESARAQLKISGPFVDVILPLIAGVQKIEPAQCKFTMKDAGYDSAIAAIDHAIQAAERIEAPDENHVNGSRAINGHGAMAVPKGALNMSNFAAVTGLTGVGAQPPAQAQVGLKNPAVVMVVGSPQQPDQPPQNGQTPHAK